MPGNPESIDANFRCAPRRANSLQFSLFIFDFTASFALQGRIDNLSTYQTQLNLSRP